MIQVTGSMSLKVFEITKYSTVVYNVREVYHCFLLQVTSGNTKFMLQNNLPGKFASIFLELLLRFG